MINLLNFFGCSEDSKDRLEFTIVDWGYLTCPTMYKTGKCPDSAHGFNPILPDGVHPSTWEPSGKWLSDTVLMLVMNKIAMMLPSKKRDHYFSSWNDAMENPISAQLLEITNVDDNPPLEDLVTSFSICPILDIDKLRARSGDYVASQTYDSYKGKSPYEVKIALHGTGVN